MTELKLASLEALREFMTFVKDKYTRKITRTEGGCDTCGYGGYEYTVGYETDFEAMFRNLEDEIDEFAQTFMDRAE